MLLIFKRSNPKGIREEREFVEGARFVRFHGARKDEKTLLKLVSHSKLCVY